MKRSTFFYFILTLVGLFFAIRLFYLQIYSDKYILNASNTSIKKEIIIPERGSIFDRKGKLLVTNQYVYDMVVTPREMGNIEEFNIEAFCKLVEIEKEDFYKKIEEAKQYSPYLPSIFLSLIPQEKVAIIQEKMFMYKGFGIIRRFLRDYKINTGFHILGYMAEVNRKEMQEPFYQMGDVIGKTGVESFYENYLRGIKGKRYWVKDRWGRLIEAYKKGKKNKKAIDGSELHLTIDWDLQEYAQSLMYNKRGSIVALNPKNGEIISLVSSPFVDPSLFVGKKKSESYKALMNDFNLPLYNRATQGVYSPASIFKLITVLVGLEKEAIDEGTYFTCYGSFKYGNKKMKCLCGGGGHKNVEEAIATSCNTYIAQTYKRFFDKHSNAKKAIESFSTMVKSFGLGNALKSDLYNVKGKVPSFDFYDRLYGKKRWNALTTISNSIGQGEINLTPIQIANLMAIIANKGFYYSPHIVKWVNQKPNEFLPFSKMHRVKVSPKYFQTVINGMEKVFLLGTGRYFNLPDIKMAGKSGTSQRNRKINGKIIPLEDHSIFALFAPAEDPQIAIAVVVESGGFGSRWAGPIASLMAEKYLRGEVTRKWLEERMTHFGLEDTYKRIADLKNSLHKDVPKK